jgi:hypothetical protein
MERESRSTKRTGKEAKPVEPEKVAPPAPAPERYSSTTTVHGAGAPQALPNKTLFPSSPVKKRRPLSKPPSHVFCRAACLVLLEHILPSYSTSHDQSKKKKKNKERNGFGSAKAAATLLQLQGRKGIKADGRPGQEAGGRAFLFCCGALVALRGFILPLAASRQRPWGWGFPI